jgi:hypothetical protein
VSRAVDGDGSPLFFGMPPSCCAQASALTRRKMRAVVGRPERPLMSAVCRAMWNIDGVEAQVHVIVVGIL